MRDRPKHDAAGGNGRQPDDTYNYEDYLRDGQPYGDEQVSGFRPDGWNGPRLLAAPTIPINPATLITPMLDKDEAEALTASVKEHGLRLPIIIRDGMIIDGRNRYYACLAAGVTPVFEESGEFDGVDDQTLVLILNVHRRHLSVGFRARLAITLTTTTHGGDRTTPEGSRDKSDTSYQEPNLALGGKPKMTRADAARICGVDVQRLGDVVYIRKHAVPAIVAQFEADKITLSSARFTAGKTKETQMEDPRVKFAGVIRKSKRLDPPTGPTTRAWMKMDDDAKLRFRNDIVEQWYEDYMRNRR